MVIYALFTSKCCESHFCAFVVKSNRVSPISMGNTILPNIYSTSKLYDKWPRPFIATCQYKLKGLTTLEKLVNMFQKDVWREEYFSSPTMSALGKVCAPLDIPFLTFLLLSLKFLHLQGWGKLCYGLYYLNFSPSAGVKPIITKNYLTISKSAGVKPIITKNYLTITKSAGVGSTNLMESGSVTTVPWVSKILIFIFLCHCEYLYFVIL